MSNYFPQEIGQHTTFTLDILYYISSSFNRNRNADRSSLMLK